jgi:hypothetical protein
MDVMTSIEELIPSSISTDAMLPSQFCERSHEAALRGELRLMSAVLEDAIGIYLNYRGSNGKPGARLAFNEVKAWLNSSSRLGPFAFLNLCDALGIDAGGLRLRLKMLRAEAENSAARQHFHRTRAWSYGNRGESNRMRRTGDLVAG